MNGLRTFARKTKKERQRLLLHDVAAAAVRLVGAQLHVSDIAMTLNLSHRSPCIVANAIQLEQVFVNLLTNARDALDHAGRRSISIPSTGQGDQVEVRVQDT